MAFASPSTEVANAVYNAAQKFGIDPSWLFAVGNNESGLNPNVANGRAGEIGPFQVLPSTAMTLGYSTDSNASNYIGTLQNNADAAAKYLSQLSSQFGGDPTKVFAAYNEGPTGFMHNGITGAVATYVSNALAAVAHYANNSPSPSGALPTISVDGQGNISWINPADGSTNMMDQNGTITTFPADGNVKGVTVNNPVVTQVQQSVSKATQNWLQQTIGGIEANIFLSGIALALIAGGITLIAQDHKQEIKVAVQSATKAALA